MAMMGWWWWWIVLITSTKQLKGRARKIQVTNQSSKGGRAYHRDVLGNTREYRSRNPSRTVLVLMNVSGLSVVSVLGVEGYILDFFSTHAVS